ncbi:MAG: tRNA (adenine-N1)-methyltransferase, partial [Anaerolineales bacterium]|nr:tRNA (adenine-N1)-methyltransferase [Anaerolineales bacterium]
VYSYEMRKDMQRVAISNLQALDLAERVTFRHADIADGMEERNLDAIFLDLPNPEDYLTQVRASLVNGGFFGSLLPTTNQVSLLLTALEANHFGFVEVCEILLRYYKPIASRLRPADRMVAHTGFLIFARALLGPPYSQDSKNLER